MSGKRLAQEFLDNLRINLRNMMSSSTPKVAPISAPVDNSNTSPDSYTGVKRVPDLRVLEQTKAKICDVLPVSIPVDDRRAGGNVPGFLHLPQGYTTSSRDRVDTAALLLSGAGGGVVGPSSIYLSMGDKLASLNRGIPVLRLDYRFPARNGPCCQDVISAIDHLRKKYQVSKFVLVGWSFGSAPVFTVAAIEPAVVGCATIAGQTAETSGIQSLSPRPVLLLHGTGDRTLSQRCSETLYEAYGSEGSRNIHLFESDDHSLSKNSLRAEELLCDFVAQCAGVAITGREQTSIIKQQLVDESEKIELMKKGGDLRSPEQVK